MSGIHQAEVGIRLRTLQCAGRSSQTQELSAAAAVLRTFLSNFTVGLWVFFTAENFKSIKTPLLITLALATASGPFEIQPRSTSVPAFP